MTRPRVDWLKVAVHIAALTPLAWLIYDWRLDQLTFNPILEITKRTGRDALVLLILTLSCSPLNRVFGWPAVMRIRRTLGVYAFFYAALHFLTFVGLDFRFDLGLIYSGIVEKPFVLVGLSVLSILLLLAVTSTNGWRRRLGKNWRRLHRLVYLAAPLAVIHFLWASKQNYGEPLVYGAIVLALLLSRAVYGSSRPRELR